MFALEYAKFLPRHLQILRKTDREKKNFWKTTTTRGECVHVSRNLQREKPWASVEVCKDVHAAVEPSRHLVLLKVLMYCPKGLAKEVARAPLRCPFESSAASSGAGREENENLLRERQLRV